MRHGDMTGFIVGLAITVWVPLAFVAWKIHDLSIVMWMFLISMYSYGFYCQGVHDGSRETVLREREARMDAFEGLLDELTKRDKHSE